MRELIDAPIVDIRAIKSQRNAILYVAKYVTKEPERLGTAKRYWSSVTYELDPANKPEKNKDREHPWVISHFRIERLAHAWTNDGWTIVDGDLESFVALWTEPPREAPLSAFPDAQLL